MAYSLPELVGPITASSLGVEPLAAWGMGYPYSMSFSSDMEFMGIETTSGKSIYNTYSGAPVPFDENLWNKIFPYGSLFINNTLGGLSLTKDGEIILKVDGISSYSLSPGQQYLAGFDPEKGTLTVYDTQNGQAVDVLDLQNQEECLSENWEGKMSPSVNYLGITDSGKSLAIACGDLSKLTIYDIDGTKRLTFDLGAAGLEFSPGSLRFSPDGTYLAGFNLDHSKTYTWKTSDGSFIGSLGGDQYPRGLKDIWFSPDNSKMLAGSWGGQVILQDIQNPGDVYMLHPEAPNPVDLDFSPVGSQLLVPFPEHFVLLDPATGVILEDVLSEEKGSKYGNCQEFVFSAGGAKLACLASRLLVWQTQDLTYPLDAGQGGEGLKEIAALQAMALVRDNLLILDIQTWKPIDSILLSEKSSRTYDFSPDGKLLALGEYGKAKILSRKEGKKYKEIEELAVENPTLLRFSPDGSRLAVIDGTSLHLFATITWEPVGVWDNEFSIRAGASFIDDLTPGLFELAFSPDSSLLAKGSGDDIHLRSADSGKLLISLPGHTSFVTALAFSPDDQLLASLSWDGTLRLWGIPTIE
jgi:WD40 repeat protein